MRFNCNQCLFYPLCAQFEQGQLKRAFSVTLISEGGGDIVANVAALVQEFFIYLGTDTNQTDRVAGIVGYPIVGLGNEIFRQRRGFCDVYAVIQPVIQLTWVTAYWRSAKTVFTVSQRNEEFERPRRGCCGDGPQFHQAGSNSSNGQRGRDRISGGSV